MPQRDQEPPRSSLPSLRSLVHVAQLSRSNAIRGRRIERRQTIDVPDPEPTLKRSNAIIRRRRCVSFDSPLSPTIPQQNALAEHLAQAEAPLGPQDARLQTLLDLPFRPHRNAFVSELDGELAPTRTPPSYPTSPDHLSASASIQRSAQTTTVDWKEVRRLPRLLTTWSQEGKSTSRIGQLLHETAYGWDRSLGNLVTTMVDQGRAYHEIGHAVLRNLDLRNEHGDPLYRDVPRGDVSLTPGSILQLAFRYEPFGGNEQETRGGTGREDGKIYEDGTSPLSYEDPHTLGPRMVCPQPRPNQGRWPFFEDDESLDAFLEGAQDEDEEEWAREERSGSNLIPTPIRPPRARRPRYVVPDYIPVSCGASIVGRDSDEGE